MSGAEGGRRLLLHACCGPCAVMPVNRLRDEGFEVVLWYHNPNIHPLSEYLRRREALDECADRLGVPVIHDDASWDLTAWLRAVRDRDAPPERCRFCCESRMDAAHAFAAANGFPFFSSSLLYSIYQPHDVIAARGARLCGQDLPAPRDGDAPRPSGPEFVYRDFRADWRAGIDITREWGVYRQPWCGCVYSEAERYAKKLARLVREEGGAGA